VVGLRPKWIFGGPRRTRGRGGGTDPLGRGDGLTRNSTVLPVLPSVLVLLLPLPLHVCPCRHSVRVRVLGRGPRSCWHPPSSHPVPVPPALSSPHSPCLHQVTHVSIPTHCTCISYRTCTPPQHTAHRDGRGSSRRKSVLVFLGSSPFTTHHHPCFTHSAKWPMFLITSTFGDKGAS